MIQLCKKNGIYFKHIAYIENNLTIIVIIIIFKLLLYNCERSELSSEFNGTYFLYI